MKNLKRKLNKEGGFTLIEMLIVVAIIAILIAIAIPLVNKALERSREATDAANERSFKAVLVISFMNGYYETGDDTTGTPVGTAEFLPGSANVYYFDAANGTLSDEEPAGYGKSTAVLGVDDNIRKGAYLQGYVDENGVVVMEWVGADVTGTGTATLISPLMVGDV